MGILEQILSRLEKRSDDAIVIVDGNKTLTVAELKKLLTHWTRFLSSNGIADGARVGIALPKTAKTIAIIYSLLSVKACYVPIDLKNPPDRLDHIINASDISFIIGSNTKPSWCPKEIKWIDVEAISTDIQDDFIELSRKQTSAESLAVILFTSGSTGLPKGIAISHRALTNFSEWCINTFKLSSQDNVLSSSPLHFDLSFFDIFAAIAAGAKLFLLPDQVKNFPIELSRYIQQNKISMWYTVPSLLMFWLLKGKLQNFHFDYLRAILFAGEKFQKKHLLALAQQLKSTSLYNLYGPAETNVCCYWHMNPAELVNMSDIPIGISACRADLTLDSKTGELLIKSPCIATGYVSKGALIPLTNKEGWYRTGDMCSIDNKGQFIFHSRLDRMFKSYGYRIEPAEIEHVTQLYPDIQECFVLPIKDELGSYRSTLFFTESAPVKEDALKDHLKKKLPAYMIPAQIVRLKEFPRLTNGKIDSQNLLKEIITSSS